MKTKRVRKSDHRPQMLLAGTVFRLQLIVHEWHTQVCKLEDVECPNYYNRHERIDALRTCINDVELLLAAVHSEVEEDYAHTKHNDTAQNR
jgi:hypothetical protein